MKKTFFTALLIVAIALSVTVISCSSEVKAKSSENYITFSTEDNSKFTLTIPCVFKNGEEKGSLWYRTDSTEWTEVKATTESSWGSKTLSCTDLTAENGKLYLKGNNTTVTKDGDYFRRWKISATSGVSLSGNIMTLLNCDSPATTMTGDNANCFNSMFSNCTSLTDISLLTLPATTLATSCYSQMFWGCKSLTKAPELPAEILADSCYYCMFYGCTGLTKAPKLPAEILADSCYQNMFTDCKGLTAAPDLPATKLEKKCYYSMFERCTSLKDAPELPATTLTDYCYCSMFSECTTLTDTQKLNATTLAPYCYACMFGGCTSLKDAPELPATTLTDGCYWMMFGGCKGLGKAPELPAKILKPKCYQEMFQDCENLYVTTNQGEFGATQFFTCPYDIPNQAVNCMFDGIATTIGTDGTPTSGNTYYWY